MKEFLELKVIEIKNETGDSKTYLLKEVNDKKINFLPGQFLTLVLHITDDIVKRNFSICTTPYELPLVGITIKRTTNGFISNYLIDNLKVGDIVNSFHPLGSFIYNMDEQKDSIILIGAGSGITPLMSILKSALLNKVNVYLIYGNRNEETIIYKNELDSLQEFYKNQLRIIHVLSQPGENWIGYKGRISKQIIEEIVTSRSINLTSQFYICGPGTLIKETLLTLLWLGVARYRIHREYYTIAVLQDSTDGEEIKTHDVSIIFRNEEHNITIPAGESILSCALAAGLEIPNSCNIGECGSCMAKLLSGRINLVEQTALTDKEIADGFCLTCVGFPLSDDIVIDYDATSIW